MAQSGQHVFLDTHVHYPLTLPIQVSERKGERGGECHVVTDLPLEARNRERSRGDMASAAALAIAIVIVPAVFAQDTDPPILVDFDFSPKNVDTTSGPATVTCAMTLQDSPSGVDRMQCNVKGPVGTQREQCNSYAPFSGDINNGIWTCDLTIPQYSSEGTWTFDLLETLDYAGNFDQYGTAEITALGFPTELELIQAMQSREWSVEG